MNCVDCGKYSWADNGGHEINKSCCEHCLVALHHTDEKNILFLDELYR